MHSPKFTGVRPSAHGLIDDGAYHQQVLLPARVLLSLATNSHYSAINQKPYNHFALNAKLNPKFSFLRLKIEMEIQCGVVHNNE